MHRCPAGYNIPALRQYKTLVQYAAFKEHIGFYPTPTAIIAFSDELAVSRLQKAPSTFLSANRFPYL